MSTEEPTPSPRRSLRSLPLLARQHEAALPSSQAPADVEAEAPAPDAQTESSEPRIATKAESGAESLFWGEVDALRNRVSQAMANDERTLTATDATQREIGRSYVETHLREQQESLMREGHVRWDSEYQDRLKKALMAALFGLGRLQSLVEIDTVENIEITGFDSVLLLHSDGRREWAVPVAESDEQLVEYLQFLASRRGASGERAFTRANPMLSLSLPPDLRLQAAAFLTPRPKVVIRRDRLASIDLEGLRELDELDDTLYDFLTAAVRAHKSIVVSGSGQGSGKTTLLRALMGQMDPWESIVTIETEFELRLDQRQGRHHRVTPFQARTGSGEIGPDGKAAGEYTVDQVAYDALRMNADRLAVGEVRGKEVIAMFKMMQMGNGSFSTIHANSARDVVERLVTCAVEEATVTESYAYRQVFQHIDLIVFLGSSYDASTRRRHRYIREVIEIDSPDQAGAVPYSVNQIFAPRSDGRAVPTGVAPTFIADLQANGFEPSALSNSAGTWREREAS